MLRTRAEALAAPLMNWPPPRPGQVCRTTRLVGSGGSVSSMWEVAWSAAESSSSLGSDPPLLPAGGQWGRPSPGWSTAFYGRLPRSALATCPNTMVPGRSAMSGSAADRRTGPRQWLLAHGPRGRCRCLPAGTGQATVTDPADLTRSPATRRRTRGHLHPTTHLGRLQRRVGQRARSSGRSVKGSWTVVATNAAASGTSSGRHGGVGRLPDPCLPSGVGHGGPPENQ